MTPDDRRSPLRRAREQPAEQSPMLTFVREMRGRDWPADIARNHDKYLEEAHLDTHTNGASRDATDSPGELHE